MSNSQHSDQELSPLKRAFLAVEELQNKLDAIDAAANEPIAVIGVACRFPGARIPRPRFGSCCRQAPRRPASHPPGAAR